MEFRRDINALRAIAVLLVVVFHFSPESMPGGFIGVDIFFVISGFLMTAIIIGKLEKKSFSIFDFYEARFKRIVPALVVMLITLTIFLWNFQFDIEFERYLKHLFASLLFYSNILYWQEAGYFTAVAHENWLLHTWSLSVEWQFYLLYPIILVPIYSFLGKKVLWYLILAAAISSFTIGVFATQIWPDPAYFSLPTRAWQMLVGSLVFLCPIHSKFQKAWMKYLGFAAILTSAFAYSPTVGWPGYHALLPILGTSLILYSNCRNTFLMDGAIVQLLGKWSYSIYLWHWPIVVFLYNQPYSVEWYHLFAGVLISILFGFLSFTFIESMKFFKLKIMLYLSIVVFAGTASTYATGHQSLRSISADPRNIKLEQYKNMQMSVQNKASSSCRVSEHLHSDDRFILPKKCIHESGFQSILIWGDSHAESLSIGLINYSDNPETFSTIVSSGCQPSFNQTVGNSSKLRRACDAANKLAFDYVVKNKPDIVIVAMKDKHEEIDWGNTLEILHVNGVEQVIVIGPTPQFYPSLPLAFLREQPEGSSISTKKLDRSLIDTDKKMKVILETSTQTEYISLIDWFCGNQDTKLSCKVRLDEELIYFDYGHLTPLASLHLAEKVLQPIISKVLSEEKVSGQPHL